jgi:hypothetical protein
MALTASGQDANDTIDPDHFNYELTQSLFLHDFNAFRTSIKAPLVEADPILQKAAQDQAAYCMKTNLVTHFQPENDKKADPKKRVEFYHGNHPIVGENCLMTFLFEPAKDVHTNKTTTIYTYAQLAKGLFEQWKNSPPHYANMINTAYTRTGIDLSMYSNKKIMYATQVFASDPYSPPHNGLKYSDTTWGVKEHVDGKCKPFGEYDFLATAYSSYIVDYGDTLYQYYQDEKVVKDMLTGPRDGLAIDLVFKSQFFCDKPNNLHPSTVFDGYMLPPRYRDRIFKDDLYKNEELLSYVGAVPPAAPRRDMQTNVILIQNGMACRYSYPVRVEHDILKDLPIYPQWCKAEGTIQKGIASLDKKFEIPFEKNATKQDTFYFKKLKELLHVFDGAITTVEIDASSSVEGTKAINISLQKARADFIESFIKKNINQPVTITKNAIENWPKMYEQIRNSGLTHFFNDSNQTTLRRDINLRMEEPMVKYWLDEQRVATVKIHLHKEYNDTTEARFLPLVLYDRMYKGDSAQAFIAYSRIIDAYQRGDLSKNYLSAIEVPMERKFLPVVNNYLASLIVQSDIFNYNAYSRAYIQYIDSAEKKFPDFRPLRFNMAVYRTHLYFHGQLDSVKEFRKLGKIVDTLCRDTTIDKKLRYQLEFNYYLSGSIFYFNHRLYKDMFASFDRVKGLLPLASLRAQEVYDIGKYFNFFARYNETIKLLDTYLETYPEDEDMIYLYVNTGALVNINTHYREDFYYQQMEKLAVKNKPRLCRWFNENYQLLREPEFKKRICTHCILER